MAKQSKVKNKNNLAMWVMFSPYLFLLISFGLIPIIMAVLEVPHESRVNPDGGWDAFKIVLQDFRFLPAVGHVLGFMGIKALSCQKVAPRLTLTQGANHIGRNRCRYQTQPDFR